LELFPRVGRPASQTRIEQTLYYAARRRRNAACSARYFPERAAAAVDYGSRSTGKSLVPRRWVRSPIPTDPRQHPLYAHRLDLADWRRAEDGVRTVIRQSQPFVACHLRQHGVHPTGDRLTHLYSRRRNNYDALVDLCFEPESRRRIADAIAIALALTPAIHFERAASWQILRTSPPTILQQRYPQHHVSDAKKIGAQQLERHINRSWNMLTLREEVSRRYCLSSRAAAGLRAMPVERWTDGQ